MAFLAMFHWGFFVGAGLLGLLSGWIAVVQRGARLHGVALYCVTALLVALLTVSVMRWLPGRAGYWLDLALAMLFLYAVGCTIGSLLRGMVVARGTPR